MVAVFVAVLSQFISDVGYTVPQSAHSISLEVRGDDRNHRRNSHPSTARAACVKKLGGSILLMREIAHRHVRAGPGAVLGGDRHHRADCCRCTIRCKLPAALA